MCGDDSQTDFPPIKIATNILLMYKKVTHKIITIQSLKYYIIIDCILIIKLYSIPADAFFFLSSMFANMFTHSLCQQRCTGAFLSSKPLPTQIVKDCVS